MTTPVWGMPTWTHEKDAGWPQRKNKTWGNEPNLQKSKQTNVMSAAIIGSVANTFLTVVVVCNRWSDVNNLTIVKIPWAHVDLSRLESQERKAITNNIEEHVWLICDDYSQRRRYYRIERKFHLHGPYQFKRKASQICFHAISRGDYF